MSGGWASGRNVGGDLVAVDDRAAHFNQIWTVEIKHQEGWCFDDLLKNPQSKLNKFWEQCNGEARSSGVQPMLLCRRNHHPFYFCIRQTTYDDLRVLHARPHSFLPHVLRFGGRVFGLAEHFFHTVDPRSCLCLRSA